MKGVFEASKKDGSVYYRASITYRSKHISLGSYSNEADAAAAYEEAVQVLSKKTHRIDRELLTSSYKKGKNKLDFDKYITLINFRDNGIYLKNPIYLLSAYILYFLKEDCVLKFDKDDLFYYSNHKIMARGGYLFVNDYGSQRGILARRGIRKHAVEGRDYRFINGDNLDFRYSNLEIINPYNGVRRFEKEGRLYYRALIHINGEWILGDYTSQEAAAIAFNKACDMASQKTGKEFDKNYIDDLSPIKYASLMSTTKISKRYIEYIKSL